MIEYLAPSGGSLTYPIRQITLDLSLADFTKLNSSPIELITGGLGEYNCPIQIVIDYSANALPNDTIFIGYETLLGSNIATAYCTIGTFPMSLKSGVFNLTTRFYNNTNADTIDESLVLWQQNDVNNSFKQFIIYITYITFPVI